MTTIALSSPGKQQRWVVVPDPPTVNGVHLSYWPSGRCPERRPESGNTKSGTSSLDDNENVRDVLAKMGTYLCRMESLEAAVQGLRNDLNQINSDLSLTRSKLHETNSKLHETNSKLHETNSKLHETNSKLHETNSALHETQRRVINHQGILIQHKIAQAAVYDSVEQHEVIALCLQGFNDIIHDVERHASASRSVLSEETKKALEKDGLGYITQLFQTPCQLLPLSEEAEARRRQALGILTESEARLCSVLVARLLEARRERNVVHHPKPDRSTTLRRLRDIGEDNLETLRDFLATNPKRIRRQNEAPDVDRELFAPDGTYLSTEDLQHEIDMMAAEKAHDEQRNKDLLATFVSV
ncbi:hypothetical protein B0H11DRAFT_2218973 [Mycena galericulata]|nr:hypothetical protein B0H11DRAFT_2218973 [Mycena galericulata]